MKKMVLPKLLLCFFLLANFPCALRAQTSEASFEKKLVGEFCDTFTKTGSKIAKEDWAAELGFMILPLISKYKEQIKNEWNLDVDVAEDLSKASEKIGGSAAMNCPSFQEFIKNNLSEIQGKGGMKKTVSGKILKIEGSPFSYFLVQNKTGKTEKIYWMEFFPGADQISLKSETVLNKAVTITYKEMEVYDAASKEYRMIKVASSFAFNP